MATNAVQDLKEKIMGTNAQETPDLTTTSGDALRPLSETQSQSQIQPSLSYVWATDESVFSSDVDRWIGGDNGLPVNAAVQPSRQATSQRSTIAMSSSVDSTSFWYLAAMVLPLFSATRYRNWRCTPSTVLNTAELLLSQIAGYYGRARSRLHHMSRQHAARDVFASAMDIILIVYAVGFLLLSMYQAAVFQQY